MREALTCASPNETQYYSAVLVHFPPVCYYCGLGKETLVDDDEMKELNSDFLCGCFAFVFYMGKSPICKRPSNVAKWGKKSWLLHVLYCRFVHSIAFLHCSLSNKLKWNIWKLNDIHFLFFFLACPPGPNRNLICPRNIKLNWNGLTNGLICVDRVHVNRVD